MKTIPILFLIAILPWHILSAQSLEKQVIGAAGASVSNGSISLDFTVGEAAVTTLSQANFILTQGFHQGEMMTTSVNGLPVSVAYKIFPNPTADKLWLEMTGDELDLYVLLYTEIGQPLSLTKRHIKGVGQWQDHFDLSKVSTGLYLLVFTDANGNWLASQKFIKQ